MGWDLPFRQKLPQVRRPWDRKTLGRSTWLERDASKEIDGQEVDVASRTHRKYLSKQVQRSNPGHILQPTDPCLSATLSICLYLSVSLWHITGMAPVSMRSISSARILSEVSPEQLDQSLESPSIHPCLSLSGRQTQGPININEAFADSISK